MPLKTSPEKRRQMEALVEQYHPALHPLPREEAEQLGHSREVIRVRLCALHMPELTAHEVWVMQELGEVCHLEIKKIRTLLAARHREWIDLAYPWLK
ncbi:hypothetical protein [Deinococcus cellulosilyticus]|uniref:Uncharacterized protein n=1 Tax=Deinococcus cellulosilyticus (strain DSM 18568 / NBRC 106333 / KACC 11606 / 5516J-15) TaxID=1223518 RepID=A0A511N673_DEIC1|nr:hypothetical protein [Deinococcus cellulosilyticus]GEM48344.1 hypothetical protein DC3_39790 [Deinococcus cellulosilyticus NBRC 106333 = KACC 11606]